MAITVGTPATGNGGTISDSTVPFSYTVPTGTKFLLAGIAGQFTGSNGEYDTANLDGVSMTRLVSLSPTDFTRAVALFGLVNPTEGAGTINIHYTFPVAHIVAPHIFAVDLQGDFFSVARSKGDTQTNSNTNPSVTYTASASAGVVFDMYMSQNEATPDAGQTAIYNNTNGTFYRVGASYETHSGSNPTLAYTGSGSAVYAGVEIIESFAPPPVRSFIL